MAQTIRIKRRITGAPAIPTGLAIGELAYNDLGADANDEHALFIGTGTATRTLVSNLRQLELEGAQSIAAGAANAKTFDLTNFRLLGGAAGNILTRGAAAG